MELQNSKGVAITHNTIVGKELLKLRNNLYGKTWFTQ